MKYFAFITTCKGRLDHVKKSAGVLLRDPRIDAAYNHYILVDYNCPQRSGQWLQQIYGSRANVVTFPQAATFHKTHALNLGIARAKVLGANYLVFLDADFIASPQLLDYIFKHAAANHFMIMLPNRAKRDLCGFLGAPLSAVRDVGGFDERMIGWGGEDIDMRLRLHLICGLPWFSVPCNLAWSIAHSDHLRTAYCPLSDKNASNRRNMALLDANIQRATGATIRQLLGGPQGKSIRVLLGLPPATVPR